ncbi:hypothetical protein [Rufibacter ruber]|uniref:hypothetical protein n=1 Tax=Rufibacter ruber TaxID=1783499 RepID=UPI000ADF0268|nr:hypothetical protein [Rufibacter ruber]
MLKRPIATITLSKTQIKQAVGRATKLEPSEIGQFSNTKKVYIHWPLENKPSRIEVDQVIIELRKLTNHNTDSIHSYTERGNLVILITPQISYPIQLLNN